MKHSPVEFSLSLYFANAKLRVALDRDLNDHCGIDFDDFALLHLLAQADESTLDSLRTPLGVSRAALLQRTRPLEKIGLIASKGDLTARHIRLSKAGERTLKRACQLIDELGADLEQLLPESNF